MTWIASEVSNAKCVSILSSFAQRVDIQNRWEGWKKVFSVTKIDSIDAKNSQWILFSVCCTFFAQSPIVQRMSVLLHIIVHNNQMRKFQICAFSCHKHFHQQVVVSLMNQNTGKSEKIPLNSMLLGRVINLMTIAQYFSKSYQ